jgi:hypothetical protein
MRALLGLEGHSLLDIGIEMGVQLRSFDICYGKAVAQIKTEAEREFPETTCSEMK